MVAEISGSELIELESSLFVDLVVPTGDELSWLCTVEDVADTDTFEALARVVDSGDDDGLTTSEDLETDDFAVVGDLSVVKDFDELIWPLPSVDRDLDDTEEVVVPACVVAARTVVLLLPGTLLELVVPDALLCVEGMARVVLVEVVTGVEEVLS